MKSGLDLSQAELLSALEASGAGITLWDFVNQTRAASSLTNQLLGLPEDAPINTIAQFIQQAVHPDDRENLTKTYQTALDSTANSYEVGYRVIWADKSVHNIMCREAIKRDESGKAIKMRGVLLDITEQKKIEQEKMEAVQLAKEIAQKRTQEAESNQRQQEDFINTISHEIRNPLQGIMGGIEISNEILGNLDQLTDYFYKENKTTILSSIEKLKEEVKQLKDNNNLILQCSNFIKLLADDVLTLAKIDAGKLPLHITAFNPKQNIQNVISLYRSQIDGKHLEIKLDVEKADFQIESDEQRFKQILMNLLTNAIKFTEKGSITITAELVPITGLNPDLVEKSVSTIKTLENLSSYELRCHVIDTGIGITPGELGKLFVKFNQANNNVSSKHGGTGLGLVLCRRFSEGLGGKIEISSEKGLGTDVVFNIKCAEYKLEQKLEKENTAIKNYSGFLKGYKILIVDDQSINQLILIRFLKSTGCTYQLANDGIEAVKKCEQAKETPFDLILMDIIMPNMDGLEASKLIHQRQTEQGQPLTKIIAMSGNVSAENKEEAIRAGLSEYLIKPYDKSKLFEVLDKYLITPKSTNIKSTKKLKSIAAAGRIDEIKSSATRSAGMFVHTAKVETAPSLIIGIARSNLLKIH